MSVDASSEISVHRTRRRSFCRTAVLVLCLSSGLLACTAEALLVIDPILAATADADGSLTRETIAAARAAGAGLRVARLQTMTDDEFPQLLLQYREPVVVLPALLASEAVQFAGLHPERRFYLVGRETMDTDEGTASGGFVAAVRFDRRRAFNEAGRAVTDWLASKAEPGARVRVFFLADSQHRASELEAFRSGLGEETSSRLQIREFSSRPDRDQLRELLRAGDGDGPLLAALFLGAANSAARDQLGNRQASLITEGLPPGAKTEGLAGYISDGFADAVRVILAADPEERLLVVESRFVVPRDG